MIQETGSIGVSSNPNGESVMDRRLKNAIELAMLAYEKWNTREEGGEDGLHYAMRKLEDTANNAADNSPSPPSPNGLER